MVKVLNNVLKSFERKDGTLRLFNDEGIHIANAIEEAFVKAEYEAEEYDITFDIILSLPTERGYADFGYVSVAWIDYGRVFHRVYHFE